MTQEGRSSVVLEDCLKEPELPPSPLLDEAIYQVNLTQPPSLPPSVSRALSAS